MLNTITFNTWPPTELSLHRQDSASGNTKHNNVKLGIRWPIVATDRVVTMTVWVYITYSLEDSGWQGMLNYAKLCCVSTFNTASGVSLAAAATSITFVATSFVAKKKHACHDKTFVVTNIFLSFVTTDFCHNKLTFVATSLVLPRQTHLLSRQKYACHDKSFVATNICPRQT